MAHELEELIPIMDKHSDSAFTEYCLPTYQGTVMLQKLALLWMLEDQEGKLVKSARKKESKIKERKIPSGPEVRKPHQKLMDQSPLPFTVRIRIPSLLWLFGCNICGEEDFRL